MYRPSPLPCRASARGIALRWLTFAAVLAIAFPTVGDDTKSLIAAAYDKTKTAQQTADFSEIIELCQKAEQAKPSEPQAAYLKQLSGWAFNKRGETYADQAATLLAGDPKQSKQLDADALADFEMAISHDPSRWKPFHNRGVSLALLGRYEAAIEDFTRVTELNAEYANAWFNRAEIRYERNDLMGAIADYTEVIRLKPEDRGAYAGRGHANYRAGHLKEALADYDKVVELDPPNANALANRGDARHLLGMWEPAAEDYRRAIQLDDGLARAYQAAAWLMATCPEERYRNPKLAVQAAKKAVALLAEENLTFLDTLAAAYAEAGRYDDAVETLREAIALATTEHQAGDLNERLALYQTRKPYRQPTPATASTEPTIQTR